MENKKKDYEEMTIRIITVDHKKIIFTSGGGEGGSEEELP